ncbi:FAD binding domain-containing protein [Stigmatella aurantiaca]|uniref:Carbon monoxide dehydrogenase medium chain n=1 Tax=Stigmatella aurantiaca (strain DW4/3-1) TaxID=378806 RepID=Q08XR3_STIAD|nr:xanthine dehydrogenase family protein subunit M [Stigmatella aurantiaca]ADO73425.1 Carbon monoxide dehydrogenase medium chain [Stigmatella aurantiaca DW4/3-1]EAU65293.1 carbon monoxide dehydrogenase medium chain [Stigmatella aurantiaca DW4/3-1]
MRYAEPATVEEGVALLASTQNARCLAGGATLVAMMNARHLAPELLISLHRMAELSILTETPEGLWLGAMLPHRALADEPRLRGAMEVIRSAASQLAHPAIRNMGTIGGSLCLADPSTELPVALVAASAHAEIAGPEGRRIIPVESLLVDRFQTSLRHGELVTRIWVPRGGPGAVGHHLRFSRVASDYPTVSISLVLALEGGTCRQARVAVGSCGPVPLHVEAADQRLVGSALDAPALAEAGQLLARAATPRDDVRGTAEYRRLLIPRLLGRAVAQARERLHV